MFHTRGPAAAKHRSPKHASTRYSEILVENHRLNLPHLYLAPRLGVTPLEFRSDFWRQKTTGVPGNR